MKTLLAIIALFLACFCVEAASPSYQAFDTNTMIVVLPGAGNETGFIGVNTNKFSGGGGSAVIKPLDNTILIVTNSSQNWSFGVNTGVVATVGFANQIGILSTNFALQIGLNATNESLLIGQNNTNLSLLIGQSNTNLSYQIGLNTTNLDTLSGWIPPSGIYTFTNLSTGTGDGAFLGNGQLLTIP